MPFKLSTVATIGLLCVARTEAWWLSPGLAKTATTRTSLHLETSRHDDHVEVTTSSSRRQWILETLKGGGTVATAASLISAGAAWQHRPAASWASGGATAGGVYLLSAKQRYNERVKAGTKGFAGLRPLIESGNVDGIRSYFASEDVGSWKDLSTAGYLLANAFRTNSSAAPDSLPSVKKWKAFAGNVEAMTKALKKKDIASAQSAYESALGALDEYLEKVELSSAS